MFDEGGGSSLAANGKVSISASIWLETLLGVDTKDRDGRHKETLYSIHEIAGDWLGWNLTNYRMTGKSTGRALAIALHSVNNIWVTMNDRGGGYSPVLLGPVSGLGLNDKVVFELRLPPGHVGPQVDRALLRRLRKRGQAYRAYLSLIFEWDKYGSRNGKLTRFTRPVVRRAGGGQVVDGHGNIILGHGGQPVSTPHHPRAIRTGEREPNPYRTRYPEYGVDDLVRLANPAQVFDDSAQLSKARQRVRKMVEGLEAEGVVVETLGSAKRPRYRIMPPEKL